MIMLLYGLLISFSFFSYKAESFEAPSWYKELINKYVKYFQQPTHVPQDFETLPIDVKRMIVYEAILSESTLEKAIQTTQNLSRIKRFYALINSEQFMNDLMSKLTEKARSDFNVPWEKRNSLHVALALGMNGAREWIKRNMNTLGLQSQIEQFIKSAIYSSVEDRPKINAQVKFLLESGFNPNQIYPPLLIKIVESKNADLVKIFLDAKADPNKLPIMNIECPTDLLYEDIPDSALDIALKNKDQEIIRLLKRAGAKSGKDIIGGLCNVM